MNDLCMHFSQILFEKDKMLYNLDNYKKCVRKTLGSVYQ